MARSTGRSWFRGDGSLDGSFVVLQRVRLFARRLPRRFGSAACPANSSLVDSV
jgi:hypothetical protein